MKMRNFSNSMLVAEYRYIQSVHENDEHRNPDALVRHFLSPFRRWRLAWLGKRKLAMLRSNPLYYYLLARTKYYDGVFLDAVFDNTPNIINIGCGSDTRSIRFEHILKQKAVKVLECDQQEAISDKQRMTKQRWHFDHIAYLDIDLNDDTWPNFENWLGTNNSEKALVLMEGVSPYVNFETFGRFLSLLASRLPVGSRVAYDFKLRGIADDFGCGGRTQRPFRLTAEIEDVVAYHEGLGFRLNHFELSSDLSARLLPGLANADDHLFREDGLILLEVVG